MRSVCNVILAFVTLAVSAIQTVEMRELIWDTVSLKIRGKPSVYMSKLVCNRFLCLSIHLI